MSPTVLAFIRGLFVGVLGGFFIIGLLQMARKKPPAPDPPKDWGPDNAFVPQCPVCSQPLDAWHSNRPGNFCYWKRKTEN